MDNKIIIKKKKCWKKNTHKKKKRSIFIYHIPLNFNNTYQILLIILLTFI